MAEKHTCLIIAFKNSKYLGTCSIFSITTMISILLVSALDITILDTYQQAMAQSSEDGEGIENFVAQGQIDSTIYTISGNWNAQGKWALTVSDGNLVSFNTDMVWNNRTAGHSHEFRNFQAEDDSIELSSDRSVTIEGEMDVGTNQAISWPGVPSQIVIEKGKIITISLDDEDTNNHFGDQSIHGTISTIKPCALQPGPNMEVPTGCT
jgi:hypothetical protein